MILLQRDVFHVIDVDESDSISRQEFFQYLLQPSLNTNDNSDNYDVPPEPAQLFSTDGAGIGAASPAVKGRDTACLGAVSQEEEEKAERDEVISVGKLQGPAQQNSYKKWVRLLVLEQAELADRMPRVPPAGGQ